MTNEENKEIDWSKIISSNLNFYSSPLPNWKVSFGDDTNFYFQFYIKNPPNRFQRWMIKKILGIKCEEVSLK